MNTNSKTVEMKDRKVILSTLWIFAVLNYLYADVFGGKDPEAVKQLISGTVGSIQMTEGFLLGIPSIAISLTSFEGNNYSTAGRVARELVERFVRDPIREPVLLNVNVPDIPYADLCGTEVTRLGRRHKAEPVVRMRSPRNETVYWVGAAGAAADAGPGTDFHAVERGCVSITPLQVDLTHRAQLPAIADWMR